MAKQSSTKSLSQNGGGGGTNGPGFSFGGAGSRIAKPLRGGGGAFDYANGGAGGGPNLPFISSLQSQEASPGGGGGGGGKRSSWFFNKHKD
ncbi:MAG: hypothetical protein Q9173_005195 [Seirophora scorigena]